MRNDDDAGGHPADDDVGSLPLTAATELLLSNLLPPTRRVPQQTLTEAGELINPLPPVARECAQEWGTREPE